jgi:predicted transposase YbfD/YdcC
MDELSEARGARAVRWAAFDWDGVRDPRAREGRRHEHRGLLTLLVVALACGRRTLREVESFAEDLPDQVRQRHVGLRGTPSDTTCDDLLRRQKPGLLPRVLERQVKQALREKTICHDLVPGGVVAIDGKAVWVGEFEAHPLCQRHTYDDGSPYWMLFAQRAVLVSSSAAPCLGQNFIADKEQETSEFAAYFKALLRQYGRTFEMVTSDAGACSRTNAAAVHQANKGYLFSLKANQPNLLAVACMRLSSKEAPFDDEETPELSTSERYQGSTIRRDLFRYQVAEGDTEVDMPGARQLWRVRQISEKRDKQGRLEERTVEDRYFVTNRVMSADKALRLVRLHWRIENNANWTMDVAMKEDHCCPSQRQEAVVVVSWLRLLAYNLVAIFRSRQPARHGDKLSWRRAFELLTQAFARMAPCATESSAEIA